MKKGLSFTFNLNNEREKKAWDILHNGSESSIKKTMISIILDYAGEGTTGNREVVSGLTRQDVLQIVRKELKFIGLNEQNTVNPPEQPQKQEEDLLDPKQQKSDENVNAALDFIKMLG